MSWLRDNWGTKLLALLAAIVMWFFVMKQENPIVEVTYNVPVYVQNLNQQFIIEGAPKTAKVVLRGPRNTLLAINQHTLHANLDLSDAIEGEKTINLSFNPPSGTVVESISPDQATLVIDEYAVKEVTVEIKPLGKLANDIAIRSTQSVPKVVTVSGPKRLVESVAHVFLPINIENQEKDFTASNSLQAVNAMGEEVEVTVTPHQGNGTVNLVRTRFNKAVPVKANIVGRPSTGFEVQQVTVEPSQIIVFGTEAVSEGVTDVVTVPIDISNSTQDLTGSYDLLLPAGLNTTTGKVNVHIELGRKLAVENGAAGLNDQTN